MVYTVTYYFTFFSEIEEGTASSDVPLISLIKQFPTNIPHPGNKLYFYMSRNFC